MCTTRTKISLHDAKRKANFLISFSSCCSSHAWQTCSMRSVPKVLSNCGPISVGLEWIAIGMQGGSRLLHASRNTERAREATRVEINVGKINRNVTATLLQSATYFLVRTRIYVFNISHGIPEVDERIHEEPIIYTFQEGERSGPSVLKWSHLC
jgi:hypothetical protein